MAGIPGWLKWVLTRLVKLGKAEGWIDPNAQQGPSAKPKAEIKPFPKR